jgi:prepilin signal peptidase PulO-like enzyme (type II secretory pathway)
VMLFLFKKKGRKDGIAYGPYMSLAAIATLLFGAEMLDWCLRIFHAS